MHLGRDGAMVVVVAIVVVLWLGMSSLPCPLPVFACQLSSFGGAFGCCLNICPVGGACDK